MNRIKTYLEYIKVNLRKLLTFRTNPDSQNYNNPKNIFHTCELEKERPGFMAYKPNIYIYPDKNIKLKVTIGFPKGGEIVTSIPDYDTGWDVSVEPKSIINKSYGYLFYESNQPDVWQKEEGWIIKKENLKSFFIDNMGKYGFNDTEIKDFVEYWIPRLTDFDNYVIYPQTTKIIEEVISLNFSVQPDEIFRLFYLIKGKTNYQDIKILEPNIESGFKRNNYHISEWGVLL
ncbi:MAG: hypothetical protein WCX31_15850 [Salinivirgaceae bacterium]|jgi:hypothetical protein